VINSYTFLVGYKNFVLQYFSKINVVSVHNHRSCTVGPVLRNPYQDWGNLTNESGIKSDKICKDCLIYTYFEILQ